MTQMSLTTSWVIVYAGIFYYVLYGIITGKWQ